MIPPENRPSNPLEESEHEENDNVFELPFSSTQDLNFKPAPVLTSLRKFRPL